MLFTLKEKGFTVVSSESGWASPFPSVLRGVTVVGGVPSDFYAEVDDGEVFLRAVDPIGGVYEHDAMVYRMPDGRSLDGGAFEDAAAELEGFIEALIAGVGEAMEEYGSELMRGALAA